MSVLFIFRRDLRLIDNVGLQTALNLAKEKDAMVLPIFIFTPEQISAKNAYRSAKAISFMFESLKELNTDLKEKHQSKLHIFYGSNLSLLKKITTAVNPLAIVTNEDYTPYAMQRDEQVQQFCDDRGIEFVRTCDYLLQPMGTLNKSSGEPYTVFTPFRNNAIKRVHQPDKPVARLSHADHLGKASAGAALSKLECSWNINPAKASTESTRLVCGGDGGRKAALAKLNKAAKDQNKYNKTRNTLSIRTTELSAYIKFGCVSIREVYWKLRDAYGMSNELISQLYWREFYFYVTYHFPETLQGQIFVGKKNANYNAKFNKLRWNNSAKDFQAWCKGQTGYPVVDAGMRQLNATGFMHNRARLITANFLNRLLNIDWRKGEQYYAKRLTDYDPAVNNGNWQWIASTGVDPKPYNQRLFNPWLQSKRFDPDGEYIKTWVPELKKVKPADLHRWDEVREDYKSQVTGYPAPIVDYAEARKRSLKNYQQA